MKPQTIKWMNKIIKWKPHPDFLSLSWFWTSITLHLFSCLENLFLTIIFCLLYSPEFVSNRIYSRFKAIPRQGFRIELMGVETDWHNRPQDRTSNKHQGRVLGRFFLWNLGKRLNICSNICPPGLAAGITRKTVQEHGSAELPAWSAFVPPL